jgi:hypothetical protein
MSQYSDPRSAAPSSFAMPPNRPQVVHVVARPGGWSRAVGFMLGLFAFAAIFVIGVTMGVMAILTSEEEGEVVRVTYRDGGSQIVAVIPVEGIIDARQAEFIHAAVDAVLDDRDVKAVVLRVDSLTWGACSAAKVCFTGAPTLPSVRSCAWWNIYAAMVWSGWIFRWSRRCCPCLAVNIFLVLNF